VCVYVRACMRALCVCSVYACVSAGSAYLSAGSIYKCMCVSACSVCMCVCVWVRVGMHQGRIQDFAKGRGTLA